MCRSIRRTGRRGWSSCSPTRPGRGDHLGWTCVRGWTDAPVRGRYRRSGPGRPARHGAARALGGQPRVHDLHLRHHRKAQGAWRSPTTPSPGWWSRWTPACPGPGVDAVPFLGVRLLGGEIFGALLRGRRLLVVPEEVAGSPEDFHTLLVDEQVSVLTQTRRRWPCSPRKTWSR